jgi:hypothetical protein
VGGTYAKAYDSMVGGVAPHHALTSRYAFQDPIAGEEEAFIKGAIRKVTGVGWQPKNVRKRGKQYFKRLEQRWDEALVAPITSNIKSLLKNESDTSVGPDARADAKAARKNAEKFKERIRLIIKAEIKSMAAEHKRLIDDIVLSKKDQEDELPVGKRGDWLREGRTGTFNIMKGAR